MKHFFNETIEYTSKSVSHRNKNIGRTTTKSQKEMLSKKTKVVEIKTLQKRSSFVINPKSDI